jgi:hypothetical protein
VKYERKTDVLIVINVMKMMFFSVTLFLPYGIVTSSYKMLESVVRSLEVKPVYQWSELIEPPATDTELEHQVVFRSGC